MIKIQIASPIFMIDERDLYKPLVEALSRAVPLRYVWDYNAKEGVYQVAEDHKTASVDVQGNFVPHQDSPPPEEPQKDDLPAPLDKVVEEILAVDSQPEDKKPDDIPF